MTRLSITLILAIVTVVIVLSQAQPRSAGILYEVWHTKAAQLMQQVAAKGGKQLTTELVIRSNGTETLNDVYVKYGINGDIWNVQPQLGFYCLYRKRPNDPNPPVPDCLNINRTAAGHAQLLSSAGFDYIAVDITNWPEVNTETDIAVLRPTEVLFEEWLSLRQRGQPTPNIAVWPCSPAGIPVGKQTWQYLLDNLYNNPAYDSLIYKQNGKKVVFLPDNPTCFDAAVDQQIRSNGGRNDVVTIKMWALFGTPSYDSGSWGFFSPCVTSGGAYTTSIVGEGACNQPVTMNGAQVVEISASAAYMVSQCSLPFASPGHLRGLTLNKLFQKVLQRGAPNLFMSSFNEHIGGRQAPAYHSNVAFCMGLPNDPQRDSVWVDTYGSEFSRDIEPTVEGGSRVWDVAASCVQLYKAGQTCASQPNSSCCSLADKDIFANIFSMYLPNSDYLLTNSAAEKNYLVEHGWKELCNTIGGPSVFCVDVNQLDGRAGPFMIYNQPQPGAIPLYRCIEPASTKHFFSTASNCEGWKTESILGYIATRRGGEMLRALRRCLNPAGLHLQALDLECNIPDTGILGYVR